MLKFAVATVGALAASLAADPVTYTFTGNASGELDGQVFTDVPFVITLHADTDDIEENVFGDPAIFAVRTLSTIEVKGLPEMLVLDDVGIFANNAVNAIGFWHYLGNDLLDLFEPDFDGYHLDTDLGPVVEPDPEGGIGHLLTDQGSLTLQTTSPVTFTADVSGGCYADCDGSKVLDLFDFLCFVNLFNTADPSADCDGDGALDLFDFLCFTNAFNAGC
jgi:hypothetical protein